jgi:membrane-associated protease RseP (regulator of RpoE activity)
LNLELLSIIAFLITLFILIYRDRKNIEFKTGLFIRRSNKGKKIIYDFAKKYEKKLKILGNIGVIVCIIASLLGCYLLLNSTYKIISHPEEIHESQIKFVLPTITGVKLPGFILGVPFWFWIIGVFLVMFAHEPMHAIFTRVERINIKSFGVLLFLIIPGAFVDPDERQLKKLSTLKKLRIYAAGSFGNFILGGFAWLFFVYLLAPVFYTGAVGFEYLNHTEFNRTQAFPAQTIGLNGTILRIDEIRVENVESFSKLMENKKPNQTVLIETTENIYNVTLTSDPENKTRGFLGIGVYDVSVLKENYRDSSIKSSSISMLTDLLFWIIFLNIGIGVFNLFPIKPLDGGLMFEEIVKYFYKGKNADVIINVVMFVVIGMILFNLFGSSIIRLF